MNNNFKITLTPVVTYINMDVNKSLLKDNKGKCDVFCINNLIIGKCYVGSTINIFKRFKIYYQSSYLISKKSNSIIYSTLLKHGNYKFSLDILEYCAPSLIIIREQYYIDHLKPDYNNILSIVLINKKISFKGNKSVKCIAQSLAIN